MSLLKPYAVQENNTEGRDFREEPSVDRSEFERDKSRILHSKAFRKLQYKTQVFPNEEGDLFRTRATHSLEVAQMGRAIAKKLQVNQDLVETLALGHDLGHTPFGHKGQHVLNDLMAGFGGFEHNWQSIRIVEKLESASLLYPGLNLMFETREGLLKHCSLDRAQQMGKLGERFLKSEEQSWIKGYRSASLEAQIMDWVDAVAYSHADMEDAINMNFIVMEDLMELSFFKRAHDKVKQQCNVLNFKGQEKLAIKMISGVMIKEALGDLTRTSELKVEGANLKSLNDIRKNKPLIGFSVEFEKEFNEFKRVLKNKVYFHDDLIRLQMQQEEILRTLFDAYLKNPKLMANYEGRINKKELHREICDYIAGMTDRYVVQEFQKVMRMSNDREKRSFLKRGIK